MSEGVDVDDCACRFRARPHTERRRRGGMRAYMQKYYLVASLLALAIITLQLRPAPPAAVLGAKTPSAELRHTLT